MFNPKEYRKAYYQANKDKWTIYNKGNAKRMREYYSRHPERMRASSAKYRAANGDKIAASIRHKRYGTDGADLFYKQNGLCGICAVDLLWLPAIHRHLDHCHTSNNVRGWLCNSCNRGVGWFKDDPALLKSAAKYLRR